MITIPVPREMHEACICKGYGQFYQVLLFNGSLNYLMMLILLFQVWWICSAFNLPPVEAWKSNQQSLPRSPQVWRTNERLHQHVQM